MFHPAWPGENLFVFCLRRRHHPGALIKHHEARAAGALINRANIAFHENGSPGGVVAGAFQHTSQQMPTCNVLTPQGIYARTSTRSCGLM
jgi:hypothetical protein